MNVLQKDDFLWLQLISCLGKPYPTFSSDDNSSLSGFFTADAPWFAFQLDEIPFDSFGFDFTWVGDDSDETRLHWLDLDGRFTSFTDIDIWTVKVLTYLLF